MLPGGRSLPQVLSRAAKSTRLEGEQNEQRWTHQIWKNHEEGGVGFHKLEHHMAHRSAGKCAHC